jgi:hypothetical protein
VDTLFHGHTALLLKHARRLTRATASAIPVEDVAREAEMILSELGARSGLGATEIVSPDATIREVIRYAAGRVKRRRTLIEQIAAGDDLEEVSRDLASVDNELPPPFGAPNADQTHAFDTLCRLKRGLAPADALLAALLFDDDFADEEVSALVSRSPAEVSAARERILFTAKTLGIEGAPDARAPAGSQGDVEKMRELKVKRLAQCAVGASPSGAHVEEALLRLLRDGDASDDIADAMAHVALCADCRASMTEGEVQRRKIVVVAIEAPRDAGREIERAASDARAKLVGRGEGRWTALVEASRAESFKGELSRDDASMVSRMAMAEPVDVAVPVPPASSRKPMVSLIDVAFGSGTSGSEVAAWAQVSRERRRRADSLPKAFLLVFAFVLAATTVAAVYFFTTR